MNSKAQIVATIGPASLEPDTLRQMISAGLDVARLNFAWEKIPEAQARIELIRSLAKEAGVSIPIIADLPGPRVQLEEGHTYSAPQAFSITDEDMVFLDFCIQQRVEYIALSFVGSATDVEHCKEQIAAKNGTQKVIAKVERKIALEAIDSIIAATDAIMIARGDLGNEIPLEDIPFAQRMILEKANAAGKPVITATQMMISMTDNDTPSRAEVSDVTDAILEGSDAVMLSEETASGKHPVLAVQMMERIVRETQQHMTARTFNSL